MRMHSFEATSVDSPFKWLNLEMSIERQDRITEWRRAFRLATYSEDVAGLTVRINGDFHLRDASGKEVRAQQVYALLDNDEISFKVIHLEKSYVTKSKTFASLFEEV